MPSRTLCDILEEMRQCDKTRNYGYLLGLIEEAQSAGNRMEAALWDQRDIKNYQEKISKLKQDINDLEQKKTKLKKEVKKKE